VKICANDTNIYEVSDCDSVGAVMARFLQVPFHVVKSYKRLLIFFFSVLAGWGAFIVYLNIGLSDGGLIGSFLEGNIPLPMLITVNAILGALPVGVIIMVLIMWRLAKRNQEDS
jgi:hypothetical protein